MAGTSASHIIWFIAAVIAATAISGVMVTTVIEMADRLEDKGRSISGELAYDISIENDVVMVPYNKTSHNLTIYIKNTGSREISYSGVNYTFVLFITGGDLKDTSYIPSSISIIGDGESFHPGRTMRLIYNITSPSSLDEQYQYSMKITASQYSDVADSTYIRITEVKE